MKKIFFILSFFACIFCNAQPTFFGVASVPADGAATTNATLTITITPPASMVAGDLVFVYCYCRTSSATITNTTTGGQTWNALTQISAGNATLTGRPFWCVFNGTWSVNPVFTYSASTNTNAVMLVFRPDGGNNTWASDATDHVSAENILIDQGAAATWSSPTVAYTPLNNGTVNIAIYNTDDDNTWGTLTGTGWSKTGLSAQYRNTSGSDVSSSYAYLLQSTAALVGVSGQTELTLGNDGGLLGAFIFYESGATPATPVRHMLPLMGVGEPLAYQKLFYPKR